jgi:hypothetical protein
MRRLVSVALFAALLLPAHTGAKKNTKPTTAEATLKKTEKMRDAALMKRKQSGRYACCMKKACDICLTRHGSCACAVNLAKGKGVCGQCLAGWQAGQGSVPGVKKESVKLLPSTEQALPSSDASAADIAEMRRMLLEAKRTMLREKRYGCCAKGGCNECAWERECACGTALTATDPKEKAEAPKGVCGACYDAWHAKEGAFPSVPVAEVQLLPMEMESMTEGMEPAVAVAGWFASGTAQTPRSTPAWMLHQRRGPWTFMTMGQAFLTHTQQSGPLGGDKTFSGNFVMPMASRRLGRGTLTLRSMFSFEPATVTNGFYPLLLQSGETAGGQRIRNGQHPHSFFMELGAMYTLPLSDDFALTFYGGPRGEPSLGPIPYPHRLSASENPLATLGHHFQDSTHIATNVATVGATWKRLTVEGSGFLGREPGEARWSLERGGMNSWSTRVTTQITRELSAQTSWGYIRAREALEPEKDSTRQSVSLTHVKRTSGGHIASTFVYGRNHDLAHKGIPGSVYHSLLAESTVLLRQRWWLWTRLEDTDVPSILNGSEEEFRIARARAFTLGAGRELPSLHPSLSFSVGAQWSVYGVGSALRPIYGPGLMQGVQVYLRGRLRGVSWR